MKKFDVEFARIEEYTAEIIWDGDLFEDPIEAQTAEEAVELAKQPAGYKKKLWLRNHLIYELHIDKGSPYTNIKIIKKTTLNKKCLIYDAYHKCMEKFRIKA